MIAVCYFLALHTRAVIPALLPVASVEDDPLNWPADLKSYIVNPVWITGEVLLLVLNWRLVRKDAGQSKISAAVRLVMGALGLVNYIPALVSKVGVRPALTARDLVDFALRVTAV